MTITKDRVQLIADSLKNIKLQLALIKKEELEEIIKDMRGDEAIGPLIDPGKWAGTGMFDISRKTTGVLETILKLKKELEGG